MKPEEIGTLKDVTKFLGPLRHKVAEKYGKGDEVLFVSSLYTKSFIADEDAGALEELCFGLKDLGLGTFTINQVLVNKLNELQKKDVYTPEEAEYYAQVCSLNVSWRARLGQESLAAGKLAEAADALKNAQNALTEAENAYKQLEVKESDELLKDFKADLAEFKSAYEEAAKRPRASSAASTTSDSSQSESETPDTGRSTPDSPRGKQ